jgi:hypothetical protein
MFLLERACRRQNILLQAAAKKDAIVKGAAASARHNMEIEQPEIRRQREMEEEAVLKCMGTQWNHKDKVIPNGFEQLRATTGKDACRSEMQLLERAYSAFS